MIKTTGTGPTGTLEVENVKGEFTCNILGANRTCIFASAKVGEWGNRPERHNGERSRHGRRHLGASDQGGGGSGGLCSNTETYSANYAVTTPSDLYLT